MASIPTYPEKNQSGVIGELPWVWCGTDDRDGDAGLWLAAPAGSQYTYLNGGSAAVLYLKEAEDGDDADWVDLTA